MVNCVSMRRHPPSGKSGRVEGGAADDTVVLIDEDDLNARVTQQMVAAGVEVLDG